MAILMRIFTSEMTHVSTCEDNHMLSYPCYIFNSLKNLVYSCFTSLGIRATRHPIIQELTLYALMITIIISHISIRYNTYYLRAARRFSMHIARLVQLPHEAMPYTNRSRGINVACIFSPAVTVPFSDFCTIPRALENSMKNKSTSIEDTANLAIANQ